MIIILIASRSEAEKYQFVRMHSTNLAKRYQNQCMREHMDTERELVNMLNRKKLQHFSHVDIDQNVSRVTFLKAFQPIYI